MDYYFFGFVIGLLLCLHKYNSVLLFSLFFPVVYCGPTEWRFERRRGSSSDRKNTVRHLIQMMSISESNECSEEDKESSDENEEKMDIPAEFVDLFNDKELKQVLIDLIHTADDLDLLDFKEFCRHIDTPKPMWSKTQATTGKHIPVY